MSQPSPLSNARPPVTDSPWFWAMLFCGAAVVLLSIIAPKYGKRQQRLEMQYQARQEITRRQVEGESAARPEGQEGSAPPPAAGELIIPLWPLWALFAAAFVASAAQLWRARRAGAGPRQGARR